MKQPRTPAPTGGAGHRPVLGRVVGWLLLVMVAGFGALYGFGLSLASAFRCDESCAGAAPTRWQEDVDSWVWRLLGWGGFLLLLLAFATLVILCVAPWRHRAWLPAAAIAVLAALAPLAPPDGSVVDGLLLGELFAALAALAVIGGVRLTGMTRPQGLCPPDLALRA